MNEAWSFQASKIAQIFNFVFHRSLDRPDGHMIGSYIIIIIIQEEAKMITWSLLGLGQWVWVSNIG